MTIVNVILSNAKDLFGVIKILHFVQNDLLYKKRSAIKGLAMIQYFNSLGRKTETFEPLTPGHVKIYSCGPTVYAHANLGLGRRIIVNDLLKRHLLSRGYKVTHVMNITDLDDKTIAASAEAGEKHKDFVARFDEAFFQDIAPLRVLSADHYPRASCHVGDMLAMTEKLMDTGYAYEMLRSIYFNISKLEDYGALSGMDIDNIKVGYTVDLDDYEKEDPRDFTLFKRTDLAELKRGLATKTKWGFMRPGHHIECAAMAHKFLGEQFDIHISGQDLIFPHHENEFAVGQALFNTNPARYWLHSELVYARGKKMSRSAGNSKTIKVLLDAGYSGRELRYFLISTNYRNPLNYSDEALEAARNNLLRLGNFMREVKVVKGKERHREISKLSVEMANSFFEALDDDLNISAALGALFEFVRKINTIMQDHPISKGDSIDILKALFKIDDILEVFEFSEEPPDKEAQELIAKREKARTDGDFITADSLREKLEQMGYIVDDTPSGPRFRKI